MGGVRTGTLLISSLALVACLSAPAGAQNDPWREYDQLLRERVSRGSRQGVSLALLDYAALKNDARLDRSLAFLAVATAPTERKARLAFYINAYNIVALDVVRRAWPIASINDLTRGQDTIWKRKVAIVAGQRMSLDEIEHQIIRPLNEPRIHFAVVCASVSCPDLRREAYRAANLEAQLEEQTRQFFGNTGKGASVDNARRVVRTTKLLEWFVEDFRSTPGGVEGFLRRYRSDIPADYRVETTLPYHWAVNG